MRYAAITIIIPASTSTEEINDSKLINRRIGFCFNATNKPAVLGYRAGIEDFQLHPVDNGKKTRFRRIAAFEPSFLTSCIGFVVKPILRNVFENAANNLKKLYD